MALPVVKRHVCEKKCGNIAETCPTSYGIKMCWSRIVLFGWATYKRRLRSNSHHRVSGVSDGPSLERSAVCAGLRRSAQIGIAGGSFDPQPQELPTLWQHQSCEARQHESARGLGCCILSLSQSLAPLSCKMVILIWILMASGFVLRNSKFQNKPKNIKKQPPTEPVGHMEPSFNGSSNGTGRECQTKTMTGPKSVRFWSKTGSLSWKVTMRKWFEFCHQRYWLILSGRARSLC